MTTTHSSPSGSNATIILHPTTEKLTRANQTTWRIQVLATLCGAQLEGFITGKKKAPAAEIQEKVGDTTVTVANSEYEDWLAADQQVLSFILTSVTKEVLVRIATTKTSRCMEDSRGVASFSDQGSCDQCSHGSRHHPQKGLHQWQNTSPRCSLLAMTWPLQAVLSMMKILSNTSWVALMKTTT
jgi:hypothetical protein